MIAAAVAADADGSWLALARFQTSRPTTAAARPQALASGMGDSADKTPDSLERSSRCLKEPPANSRSDADAS